MVRIVDLEELDLRAELGDDGRISRVLDQRGNEMGLVAAKTDPLTGGISLTAGGVQNLSFGRRRGFRAVVFGDSFTARNTSAGETARLLDHGYFSWANAFLGGAFSLIANAGVSGQRTDEMLARIESDVIARDPDWVFVQGGWNDINAGYTSQAVIDTLTAICSMLSSRGINVVLLAVAPNNSVTAGIARKLHIINKGLREYAFSTGGVYFVDTYAAVVDPTSATAAFASLMSSDGTHLSAYGARAYGKAISDVLGEVVQSYNYLPSSNAESYGVDSSSKQIIDNPLLIGTGSAPTGTGASGNLATGWAGGTGGSGASSAAFSLVARSDGKGNNQRIVVSGAAASSSINIRQTGLVSRATNGDVLYAVGEVTISGASDVRSVNLGGSATVGGVTYQLNTLEANGASVNPDQSSFTLQLRTPEFTIPAGSLTTVQFVVSATFGTTGTGALTMEIGRCGLYKK